MMAANWFFYALTSLLLYGFWGLFSKLATNYISSRTALVYDIIGAVLVGLFFLATNNWEWKGDIRGVVFSILTGVAGTVATLCYFVAVSKGSSSIVMPLTSLYPIITVLLAFFVLKEPITVRHLFGIGLAVIALMIFSQPD
jgi:bacterial/archaeal transporter family protein